MLACRNITLIALVFFGLSERGSADIITFLAKDSGFVTSAGGSAKGDGTISGATYNYSVGRELHYSAGFLFSPLTPLDRKNYFTFDLSGLSSLVVSAEIVLYAGPEIGPPFPGGMHGYESGDPFETYFLGGTSDLAGSLSDIAALAFGNSIGPTEFDDAGDPLIGTAAALYSKLAVGPLFAGATVTSADNGTFITIPFTPDGITYLNATAGGLTAFGGKLPSAMPPATPQSIYGYTGPDIPSGGMDVPMLIISTIPEPQPGLILLVLSSLVAGIFAVRATRRRFATSAANTAASSE